jgi:hypothetical protein
LNTGFAGEVKSKHVPRSDLRAERTASPRRLAGNEISYVEGRLDVEDDDDDSDVDANRILS